MPIDSDTHRSTDTGLSALDQRITLAGLVHNKRPSSKYQGGTNARETMWMHWFESGGNKSTQPIIGSPAHTGPSNRQDHNNMLSAFPPALVHSTHIVANSPLIPSGMAGSVETPLVRPVPDLLPFLSPTPTSCLDGAVPSPMTRSPVRQQRQTSPSLIDCNPPVSRLISNQMPFSSVINGCGKVAKPSAKY